MFESAFTIGFRLRRSIGLFGIFAAIAIRSSAEQMPVRSFIEKHCFECHDADEKKGGLDLTALPFELGNSTNFAVWVTVDDRVTRGEMPPKKKARPDPAVLKTFTNYLSASLMVADQAKVSKEGRATPQRRLNRYEYEETLRDLLSLPYLEVKAFLPEDSESHGFNKVGDALDVSHVQMARYLEAGEFALRQAPGAAGSSAGGKDHPVLHLGRARVFRKNQARRPAQPPDVSAGGP